MAWLTLTLLFVLLGTLTAMEMATFSARKERMEQACDAGDRRGTMVKAYQRSPGDYLSAIQLVATAVNFVIGALIGSNIEAPLRAFLDANFPSLPYTPHVSWTLAVGGLTVVALVFTNVLPKHIGFVRANEISIKTAPLMYLWIKVTWPLTSIVRVSTRWIARLFKIAPDEKFRVTERDIESLLGEGSKAGSINATERSIMVRAMRLSDVLVKDIMVPASAVLTVGEGWEPARLRKFFASHGRSNYPVVGRNGELRGVVRVQEWHESGDLASVTRPAMVAKAGDSLLSAVELLRPSECRLLVVMEGDQIQGVVTLNDALSAIVGPIKVT